MFVAFRSQSSVGPLCSHLHVLNSKIVVGFGADSETETRVEGYQMRLGVERDATRRVILAATPERFPHKHSAEAAAAPVSRNGDSADPDERRAVSR